MRRRSRWSFFCFCWSSPGLRTVSRAAMSAPWSTIEDHETTAVADSPRIARRVLCHAGTVLLGAQDVDLRREHILLSAKHHSARPSSLLLCRRLVRDSVCTALSQQRGGIRPDNSCKCRSERDGGLLADAVLPREADRAHIVPVLHDDPVPGDDHPSLSHHGQAWPSRFLSWPRFAVVLDHHLHFRIQGELRCRAAL